jgi:Ca-activated chloride channel homolog
MTHRDRRPGSTLAPMVALACALGAGAPPPPAPQAATPTVRIISPGEQAIVSGPVMLRALIDPPGGAREVVRVTFFANGVQVCSLERPPYECAWDAGTAIDEHHVRAVALLAGGDRRVHNVRTRRVEFAESVDVDVVQVTAVVTDARGRFVKGLRAADFRVYEDDAPQTITHFAAEGMPLELVAAVDVSSSMTEALPQVRIAAKRFLGGIREHDQVTLLAFNDNIFTLARRETSPSARIRAVDRLAPWGGTALYDVIIKALDLLGRQQGRRSLVVFSDGEDQSSHATVESVIERVESSDATLYMIGQGRGTRVPALQMLLRRLATVSGGRAFFTEQPEKLDEAFGEILDDLSHQYLLAYPPRDTARDGRWRRIRVEVNGDEHTVRARQGYRLRRTSS